MEIVLSRPKGQLKVLTDRKVVRPKVSTPNGRLKVATERDALTPKGQPKVATDRKVVRKIKLVIIVKPIRWAQIYRCVFSKC